MKIKPLTELVGAFKTTSSKAIHLEGRPDFKWQRSFYESIIRTKKILYAVRKYIQNNPQYWMGNAFERKMADGRPG